MMMAQVLPTTVEELNIQQNFKSPLNLLRKADFEDIHVEKRLKREVSLPNGVQNWNISNFDPYLTFDDVLENNFDVLASPEDRLVPESDTRSDRSNSISSLTSTMDDKQVTFHDFGVKTISTVHMDSGSTCISSDHTYFGKNPTLTKSLDPEETYQNLDIFFQQVPEITPPEVLTPSFSPLPSSQSDDSCFQTTVLETLTTISENTQHIDFTSTSTKRLFESISDDDVFVLKHEKQEVEETVGNTRYHEIRRKNNIASKNCRKTRKEKQKDMEQKVSELEQEREKLKNQVIYLEKLIKGHKQYLLNVISQKR